jgi:hypothetical protein
MPALVTPMAMQGPETRKEMPVPAMPMAQQVLAMLKVLLH